MEFSLVRQELFRGIHNRALCCPNGPDARRLAAALLFDPPGNLQATATEGIATVRRTVPLSCGDATPDDQFSGPR